MTGMLQYIFNASIIQCPSQSIKEQMETNTNDVVNIKLPSGNENEIALLPNSTSGVKFFCITSGLYSAEGITYSGYCRTCLQNLTLQRNQKYLLF